MIVDNIDITFMSSIVSLLVCTILYADFLKVKQCEKKEEYLKYELTSQKEKTDG